MSIPILDSKTIGTIMAIVNITPDSFYAGSRKEALESYRLLIQQHIKNGADIIDLGAQSSRPGAELIDEHSEWARLEPVLNMVLENFPETPISVDSFYSSIIAKSAALGAVVANDISFGSLDSNMLSTIAQLSIPYIGMHMKGSPQNMQSLASYNNVVKEVNDYFAEKIEQCKQFGINDLVLDPGFGFAKTLEHNYTLLKHLNEFKVHDKPILVGLSRKSFIQKLLNTDTEGALNGTTVVHTLALQNGANILRVHDPLEAKQCQILVNKYMAQA